MVDFALRRALSGDRDDGTRLPSLGFAGSFARPHFDWVIPFSTLPRRVLTGRPIGPSGTELIWLDVEGAPADAAIGFPRGVGGAGGVSVALVGHRSAKGATCVAHRRHLQRAWAGGGRAVLRLAGVKAIIIAGVNLGGVDLAYPFDPDIRPFEPSACTVYLVSM
jgi:hypothetical protein